MGKASLRMTHFSGHLTKIHVCRHPEKEHSRQSRARAKDLRLEPPFESKAPKRSLSGME